jgi:hypothetical protein
MTLLPTGYLSLEACVHRVADHIDPNAAAKLSAARAAHKAIEPLLAEIARIRELKRSAEAGSSISPAVTRYVWASAASATPIPQLAPEQLELQETLRAAEVKYAIICKDAEIFLRQSFGDARLPTFSLRFSDGEPETIPAPRWWTTAGVKAFTSGLWESGRVLVREADLEALLVPGGEGSPAPTELTPADESSSGSLSDGDTLPPASAQAETALLVTDRPPSERRPSYSLSALRAWFMIRVNGWPKDAPSPTEGEDLAAARNHFEGKISRDPFRKIRREKTPASWREPGPRRARR